MKIPFKISIVILIFCLGVSNTNSQIPKSTNFYHSIKNYNLGKLWRSDSIKVEGNGDKFPFPEPLGYIGDNYQRFYIHYITVSKNKENPYQYQVDGKTRVKDNICRFSGTITIEKAVLYKESDDSNYKQGTVTCRVVFHEDSSQISSGIIKGTLISNFQLDKKGKLSYDALMFVADGYNNNQCRAIWTSYKTNKSKKCNWGDFRMPDSKALDAGAGDVTIDKKFINNGWKNFVDVYTASPSVAEKALKIEESKWWLLTN